MNKITNNNGTVYFMDSFSDGIQDAFRIKQLGDKRFIIERAFRIERKEGSLFRRKTIIEYKFIRVDVYGYKRVLNRYFLYSQNFKEYKSIKKAEKWIKDFEKYPRLV